MALTTIDPKPALIIIDLQKGLTGLDTVHPLGEVVERSAELARAFRGHGLPVVLVNVAGRAPGRTEVSARVGTGAAPAPDWTEIVAELDPQPGDHRVTKERWGAFFGTPLDALLRGLGVTQVILTGVSTSSGVESTARSAYEHGYHVVVAVDAVTDTNPDTHHNSVTRIFPKLGETAATAEIVELVEKTR